MSVTILSSAMARKADRGQISANDVLELRRTVFADGVSTAEEADVLIRLNNCCAPDIEAWNRFFSESLTYYIVFQTEPRGYVNANNVDWLIERMSKDGMIENLSGLELLISILEKARWAPPRLAAFALEQIKRAITEGKGPLSLEEGFQQGVVGRTEVELLRRVLFAYSGEQHIGISRDEAEVLMELNDATAGRPNHRDWPELFVKSVSNHLLVASGYKAPPRDEILRAEAWIGKRSGIQGLFKKMSGGVLAAFFEAYERASDDERAFAQLELERVEMLLGENIPDEEASWIVERIGQNGELTENEKALLSIMKTTAPDLHPSLAPLMEMVA